MLDGPVDVSAEGLYGSAGFLAVDAGIDIEVRGDLFANGAYGGHVDLFALDVLTLSSSVQAGEFIYGAAWLRRTLHRRHRWLANHRYDR